MFILRYFRNLKFNGFSILTRIFSWISSGIFLSFFVREYWLCTSNAPFMPLLCVLSERGTCTPCTGSVRTMFVLSGTYCTYTIVILAKVMLWAHRAYVLYTSSIACYEALQKHLPVRTIPHFLFCKHHALILLVLQTSHIAQSPLSSKFLIFFLPSLLHSFLSAFLSFLVSVQLLFSYCWWCGWAHMAHWIWWWLFFLLTVGASLPYCLHV